MSNKLPWFKFDCSEWLSGNIVYEPMDLQGLFINICALYWKKEGVLEFSEIESRFKKKTLLTKLTDRFFSVNDGFIKIKFLDEQLTERQEISKKNSENGSKGGRPTNESKKANANPNETEQEPKKSHKEQDKDKEVELEKEEEIISPELLRHSHWAKDVNEVIQYFKSKNASETLATTFFNKYESQNWMVNGNAIVKWKFKADEWISNPDKFTEKKKSDNKPHENKEGMVYFRWEKEDQSIRRSIEKERAESYFANQEQGGYIAVILS